jgi:transcriptional regulator with XRE-family HTH domain
VERVPHPPFAAHPLAREFRPENLSWFVAVVESRALFAALLKFWRGRRGLSQLDFSLRAGVSSRHVSFLETGRAAPSEEMVMLLAGTLALSPRQRDELLQAAGFAAPKLSAEPLNDPDIRRVVDQMLKQHAPFPMFVLNGRYDVLDMNSAASQLVRQTLGHVPPTFNAARLLFDPAGFRPFVEDWPLVARTLIDRVQREALLEATDDRLTALLDDLLAYPGVDPAWRTPDFAQPAAVLMPFGFVLGELRLRFMTTVTRFSAPQSAALDDLQIEAWFPTDEMTAGFCRAMAG